MSNTTVPMLTKFSRLDSLPGSTRKQLRDLVGTKLFDSVFSETISVKQTNMIIESFVDSMIEVASDGRSTTQVIETMNKINPSLAKRVFSEDSDSTGAMSPIARSFVVTYIDDGNEEHTVEQRAFSPRSIRRRLEANGFEVKDIVLAATGESVLDETVSSRSLNKVAESLLADIEHLVSKSKSAANMFGRNLVEGQIATRQDELAKLIEKGEKRGMKWDKMSKKFVAERKKKVEDKKFSLADVFKK